jgi:hypothetical protein
MLCANSDVQDGMLLSPFSNGRQTQSIFQSSGVVVRQALKTRFTSGFLRTPVDCADLS